MLLEPTQAALSINKGSIRTERAEVINETGDVPEIHNLITLDLDVEGAEGYASFKAYLQGYPGYETAGDPERGSVGVHKETPTTTEIYFPLSGEILVQRGEEEPKLLTGLFPDLRYLKNFALFNLAPKTGHAILTVEDKQGIIYTLTGFVIPGGVDHATVQVKKGEFTRFLAIKIDDEDIGIPTINADPTPDPIIINF